MTLHAIKAGNSGLDERILDFINAAKTPALPAQLLEKRQNALSFLEEQGLPTRRNEDFHYTDVRSLLKVGEQKQGVHIETRETLSFLRRENDGLRIVINEDGILAQDELSDVTVMPIAQALKENALKPDEIGSVMPEAHNDLQSLNWASFADGMYIEVSPESEIGAIEFAYHLQSGAASYRNFIRIGEGAKVTLIESFEQDHNAAINVTSEFAIADRAEFQYVRYMGDDVIGGHLGGFAASLGTNAKFNVMIFNASQSMSRTDGYISSTGEGTETVINALTLARDNQHHDLTIVTNHNHPDCTSEENIRAIVDDMATSVFQGKICVDQIAQKTDGQMMARGLLLSNKASVLVKPELEIFADDVQCGHGSTTGQLDDDLLFYLMARGIPRIEAQKLMVMAFAGEILEEAPNSSVRNILLNVTEEWLAGPK